MLNLLLPNPAAMVKNEKTKTLLIADPHIGWELALQERGIHVPSQTDKILNKLLKVVIQYTPDRLVILGDVKYTVVSSKLGEWQDIPDFFKKFKAVLAMYLLFVVIMMQILNRCCLSLLSCFQPLGKLSVMWVCFMDTSGLLRYF